MNETRRKPTTGRQSPSLFDKWHSIFICPVVQTQLDIPRPLIRHGDGSPGERSRSSVYSDVRQMRTNTCQSTVQHINHYPLSHLLEERLGSLEVLNVLVKPWFGLIQSSSVVSKEDGVTHDILEAGLKAVFQQARQVTLPNSSTSMNTEPQINMYIHLNG